MCHYIILRENSPLFHLGSGGVKVPLGMVSLEYYPFLIFRRSGLFPFLSFLGSTAALRVCNPLCLRQTQTSGTTYLKKSWPTYFTTCLSRTGMRSFRCVGIGLQPFPPAPSGVLQRSGKARHTFGVSLRLQALWRQTGASALQV